MRQIYGVASDEPTLRLQDIVDCSNDTLASANLSATHSVRLSLFEKVVDLLVYVQLAITKFRGGGVWSSGCRPADPTVRT